MIPHLMIWCAVSYLQLQKKFLNTAHGLMEVLGLIFSWLKWPILLLKCSDLGLFEQKIPLFSHKVETLCSGFKLLLQQAPEQSGIEHSHGARVYARLCFTGQIAFLKSSRTRDLLSFLSIILSFYSTQRIQINVWRISSIIADHRTICISLKYKY